MELIADSGWMLLAVLAAISLGALLKGMTGLGLPLFAVPVIATLTTVQDAVILMIIPGIAANLWVVIHHRRNRQLLRQHLPFLISGFIGAIVGTVLLHVISDRVLKVLLMAWLGIYLAQYLITRRPLGLFNGKGPFAWIVGLIAGATQGSSGVSAQLVAPYYHGRHLQAPAYAFLVAFTFLLFSLAQLTTVSSTSLLSSNLLRTSLIALVPTIVFTRIGLRLSGLLSIEGFNRLLLAILCLMEIRLLVDIL